MCFISGKSFAFQSSSENFPEFFEVLISVLLLRPSIGTISVSWKVIFAVKSVSCPEAHNFDIQPSPLCLLCRLVRAQHWFLVSSLACISPASCKFGKSIFGHQWIFENRKKSILEIGKSKFEPLLSKLGLVYAVVFTGQSLAFIFFFGKLRRERVIFWITCVDQRNKRFNFKSFSEYFGPGSKLMLWKALCNRPQDVYQPILNLFKK